MHWKNLSVLLLAPLLAGCLAGNGSGSSSPLMDAPTADGASSSGTPSGHAQPESGPGAAANGNQRSAGSSPGSEGAGSGGPPPEPSWASADSALVHPGIQTFTKGAQCTANFVFYDAVDLYIGQAAHCAGTGAATDTNGCTAASLPLGTPVDLGTGHDGALVYSSWLLMQELKTPSSAPECIGNDLALIRVDPSDRSAVNPAVPFFGGPIAVGPTAGLGPGDHVYSFGNSELRLGVNEGLSWKHGTVVSADAWQADVYTASPGIPGDSGSGFLDAQGNAIGILSTVALAPLPLSNQISSLQSDLEYRTAHGGSAIVLGTAPFTGGIV